MEVIKQIEKDFSQALKEKDKLAVLVLRQLKTAVTNAEIAKKREELTEEEITKLLRSEVKKRREAAELYEKGGRKDRAEQEKNEIEIVIKYLPPELGEEEIKQRISAVIEKIGASGSQDIGKVMGMAMKELAGRADGNVVSRLAKEELES